MPAWNLAWLQRELDARKRDFRPGHFALLNERRLEAFDADPESVSRQHGTDINYKT